MALRAATVNENSIFVLNAAAPVRVAATRPDVPE
jgi:hypothetical protein